LKSFQTDTLLLKPLAEDRKKLDFIVRLIEPKPIMSVIDLNAFSGVCNGRI